MSSKPIIKTCLQILPSLGTGGVERGTIDMAQALVREGWRALVASEGGPRLRELERTGAEHFVLPLATKSPLRMWLNSKQLAELISNQSIDIVHARSRAPAWSAHWAKNSIEFPLITTFHGTYSRGLLGLKKPYNRIMTLGTPTIAVSDFIANYIANEYEVDESIIQTIYRGIDTEVFDPRSVTPARIIDLAKKWRLPDGGPIVMLPGRLASWKGHALVADALSILKSSNGMPEGWRCLMVGPSSEGSAYRSRLESYIESHGVGGDIQIIEDCRDMAAAYMVADVVISASTRPEAFGRIVAEAQAMGRPVVAPAHGAAQEIMLPGVTGWLFTPGDAKSLAGAIRRAATLKKGMREDLADRAREHVINHFSKKNMTDKTLKIYESMIYQSGK
ncbi:MAG: glycosyltransferase family 4 protein [Rhodospirillaceae bacterium]